MKKNVAGQHVTGQLALLADGTDFSGTATVYVTGDGGAQAAGSGTATLRGHGTYDYAPTQAETNFDHVAFTFTGALAASFVAQIDTDFPQTGDAFARLGAPAGASVSADVASVQTDTSAIKAKTNSLTFTVPNQIDSNVVDWKGSAAPAMTGDAYARLGAPAGASVSADVAAVKTVADATLSVSNLGEAKTDELWREQGLDIANPLVVSAVARNAGSGQRQSITEAAGVVTVQRL